jgi:hypothetical protein
LRLTVDVKGLDWSEIQLVLAIDLYWARKMEENIRNTSTQAMATMRAPPSTYKSMRQRCVIMFSMLYEPLPPNIYSAVLWYSKVGLSWQDFSLGHSLRYRCIEIFYRDFLIPVNLVVEQFVQRTVLIGLFGNSLPESFPQLLYRG